MASKYQPSIIDWVCGCDEWILKLFKYEICSALLIGIYATELELWFSTVIDKILLPIGFSSAHLILNKSALVLVNLLHLETDLPCVVVSKSKILHSFCIKKFPDFWGEIGWVVAVTCWLNVATWVHAHWIDLAVIMCYFNAVTDQF